MSLHAYLPQDRLRALARNETLPDRTSGSALFADISGFTALTEGLRETLGSRRGGEELSKHLGVVYSALIAEVEKHGGSVVNFAGDAITCWFDDANGPAAPRSLGCAFAQQQAMKSFSAIALPNGRTTALTLKIALASGPARRFMVGDPTVHYIDSIAGATVARTSRAEHLASNGETLVDEATVNALGEKLSVKEWRESEGERFAVVANFAGDVNITDQPATTRPPAANKLRVWMHGSIYDREQSGEESFLTGFRPCAVLFVRFTGIDYDADIAEKQLDTFLRQLQYVAEQYEGAVLQLTIGDKGSYAYVNFGALISHEDDARRAVKAAIELKKKSELQLQLGVTQGVMRVGAYGGATRQTFGALGDEVNLAARLMTTATEGEILVSGHVHKAVEKYFSAEPRAPLSMKGKAEPLPIFAITGESHERAVRLQEPKYTLPMVGRTEELKLIEEKLELAEKGQGQVIGIVAEPGMGKSRLVAEVIRTARKKGFVGFGGTCQSDAINTPYQAWKSVWQAFFDVDHEMSERKLMRNIEGEIEDRVPERLQAMPLLNIVLDLEIPDNDFTQTLEPKYRKSALRALLEDCLRAVAKDEPLLIAIEDLHWIDALSHDLLEELARDLSDSRICFMLAYRPPQLTRLEAPRIEALPNFTKIELQELNRAEAESAIRAKLAQLYPARGGALPTGLVDKLMARAQGNPFYLEELLNYVRDRGLDPADIQNIELPDSLHALILSRIDQLSEREKNTLRVASIIGRLFRAKWLTGYYPELGAFPTVKASLDTLSGLDITPLDSEPELAYLFKHIVTHEVTYESLPFATRARLHEQLARYLESADVPVETIAFHYGRSENKAKQMEYLRKAGETSQKNFANDAALEYYGSLLPLLNDDKEKAQIHLKRGEVLELIGKWDDAETDYRAAMDSAKGDLTLKANAQFALGKLNRLRGNYDMALDLLKQVKAILIKTKKSSEIANVLNEMGFAYNRKTDFDGAQQVLNESLDFSRHANDIATVAQSLAYLGEIARERGDYVSAASHYAESLKLHRVLGNKKDLPTLLHYSGLIAESQGDFSTARTYFEESLELSSLIGDKSGTGWAINNLGIVALVQGDYSTARTYFEKHLAIRREMGDKFGISIALYLMGRWAQSQGDFDGARSFFEEHMQIRSQMEDKRGLGYSLLNQGLVAYYQRDNQRAQILFQKSMEMMRESNDKSGMANCLFGFGMAGMEQMTAEGMAQAREYFITSLRIRNELGEKLQITSGLIGIARHALVMNNPLQAAMLLGSVDAVVKPLHITVEPDLLHFHAQTLAKVKEALGDVTFQSAWEEGSKWTLEETVKKVLGEDQ